MRPGQRGMGLVAQYDPSGNGLEANSDKLSRARFLRPGDFIAIYAGEYLTTEQARNRWRRDTARLLPRVDDDTAQAGRTTTTSQQVNDTAAEGTGNYILSLRSPSGTIHIDARHKGNVARFVNHSCEPNCVMRMVWWGTGPDVVPRAAIFVSG
jgi:histone-lysine N-methyltransferase SETMAR